MEETFFDETNDIENLQIFNKFTKEISQGETNLLTIKNQLKDIINKDTVFCCIGTDKHIADSFGPFVGTFLKQNHINKVFGTIEYPLHALNMEDRMERIYKIYKSDNILGIDSAIGNSRNVNTFSVKNHPIRPGKGVGKDLPNIGKNSIVFVTSNTNSIFSRFSHGDIRIYDMIKYSKTLANLITEVIKEKNI